MLEELSIPYCLASYPRLFRVVLFIPGRLRQPLVTLQSTKPLFYSKKDR
nr:MAG TPA: hypothetical protein [Caudoviricetes sp.]